MNNNQPSYQFINNVSAPGRIAIALLFVLAILATEIVKMNHFIEHCTIENIDFSEKGETEKEGQKKSKVEKTEVVDFIHSFSIATLLSRSYTSHNYHYQTLPSHPYLDVLQQPPRG